MRSSFDTTLDREFVRVSSLNSCCDVYALGYLESMHILRFPFCVVSTMIGFTHLAYDGSAIKKDPSFTCVMTSSCTNSISSRYDLWLLNCLGLGCQQKRISSPYAIHVSSLRFTPIAFQKPSLLRSRSRG